MVASPIAADMTIQGHADARGAELRFVWPAEVPAALFERASVLWAVFAAPEVETNGWDDLKDSDLGGWLKPVEARIEGDLRWFRLALQRDARVEVEREGPAWIVRLRPTTDADPALPPEGVERDTVGGSLRGSEPTRGFLVRDPDSGEQLGVLLATRGTLRHPAPMRLVDVEILPSAQGLAWRPLADGVKATAGPTGFVLSRRGGLRFSAIQDGSAVGAAAKAMDPKLDEVEKSGGAALPSAPLALASLASSTAHDRQEARSTLMARLPTLAPVPAALGRLEAKVLSAMRARLSRATLESVLDVVEPALPPAPVLPRPPRGAATVLTVDEVVDDRAAVPGLQPDLHPPDDVALHAPAHPLRPAVLHDLPVQPRPQPVEHPGGIELGSHHVGRSAHIGLVDDVDEGCRTAQEHGGSFR